MSVKTVGRVASLSVGGSERQWLTVLDLVQPCLTSFLTSPPFWLARHVDGTVGSEEDSAVDIRFGHDLNPQCMTMDETLMGVVEKVQNFAVIYLCDIIQVPDFNKINQPHSMFLIIGSPKARLLADV